MVKALFIILSSLFIVCCSNSELKSVDATSVDPSKILDMSGLIATALSDVSVPQAKNCLLAFEGSNPVLNSLDKRQREVMSKVGNGFWGDVLKREGAKISLEDRATFNDRADGFKMKTIGECSEILTGALAEVNKGLEAK